MTESSVLVAKLAMLVFLLAGMLELGLSLTFGQVLAPLRNLRLLILAFAANFLIAPLLAFGIAKVMRLEHPFAVGLLLLALAPGAPFIPKLVQLARGDLAFAVGLMVLLMVGTVICLPVVLPKVVEGAQANPWKIAQPLLLFMLLPLIVGLVVHARFKSLPAGLRPTLAWLSNLSGLLVIVLIVALNFRSVLSAFGTGAIFAGLLFVVLSIVVGWLLGGTNRGSQISLGLGTGSRNVAAALLIGAQNLKDPKVNVMVILSAIASLLILLPMARVLGKRASTDVAAKTRDTGLAESG